MKLPLVVGVVAALAWPLALALATDSVLTMVMFSCMGDGVTSQASV